MFFSQENEVARWSWEISDTTEFPKQCFENWLELWRFKWLLWGREFQIKKGLSQCLTCFIYIFFVFPSENRKWFNCALCTFCFLVAEHRSWTESERIAVVFTMCKQQRNSNEMNVLSLDWFDDWIERWQSTEKESQKLICIKRSQKLTLIWTKVSKSLEEF